MCVDYDEFVGFVGVGDFGDGVVGYCVVVVELGCDVDFYFDGFVVVE